MEGESAPNPFVAAIGALFHLFGEMLSALFSVLPKIISFLLWVIVAVIVLPCVFVAGNIYPAWVEWGEDF
jgi:hypothetical protein